MKLKQTYTVLRKYTYSDEWMETGDTYEDRQVAQWEKERRVEDYYVYDVRTNSPPLLQELLDCGGLAAIISWVRNNVRYPDRHERLVWFWYETAYKQYVVQKTVETSHTKALEDVKTLVADLDVIDDERP